MNCEAQKQIHTWLSNPRSTIMMKKKQAHSGETGIMDTARGYAMNAKPGPERDHAEKHNSSVRN